jgi:hypothetical protein
MSDTQNIDDKKNNNNGSSIKDKATELVKFVVTAIILVSMVIFYFSLGGVILYACKLGQSNILPTIMKCFPYSDTKPEIEAVVSNIFVSFTNPPMSAKLSFPYDKSNSKNMVIDLFRDYQTEPKASFMITYFISIVEALVGFNYWSINHILGLMNVLPEPVIVIFGPIMAITLSIFLLLFDNFYLMYLWFAKMGWFFKTNSNPSDTQPPEWTDVTFLTPFYYCLSILLVFLFVILFFVLLICLPVLPFITVAWCCLTCLLFKSELNKKPASVFTVVKDTFKFYKVTIMAMSSACIVLSAFAHLGPLAGIVSIISLCLIIWGIVSVNIFKPIKPEDLSALVSNNQAKKSCSVKAIKHAEKQWFPLMHWLFSSQKGGKHLTNELKKLGGKLNQPEIQLQ